MRSSRHPVLKGKPAAVLGVPRNSGMAEAATEEAKGPDGLSAGGEAAYRHYSPSTDPKIAISVIVIAYNRKKYIKRAIESLLKQSFKNFEIIVVKNFEDAEFDSFLEQNHIINIHINKSEIGAHYAEGMKFAKGNLIAFLDDDDYYDETKLERVYEIFNKNKNLCFYYNNIYAVNDEEAIISSYDRRAIPIGRRIELKNEMLLTNNLGTKRKLQIMKYYEAFWSPSCIVIKKDPALPYLSKFEKIHYAPGIFLASVFAELNCDFFLDNRKLTYYRIHTSASHASLSNKLEYFKNREEFYLKSLISLILTKENVNDKYILDFLNIFLITSKFYYYLYSQSAVVSKGDLLSDLLTINKSKYLLRISELVVISSILLIITIIPRKILRNIFYYLEKKRVKF